ncbi:MAG TPA: GMC family oxidoreductase N-terminal domain-containing protein [Thermoplasmata archaeon]|nr:GMC family oxidoreductase N-terminal domain-containing protein [Thermoplasmata archaeon]
MPPSTRSSGRPELDARQRATLSALVETVAPAGVGPADHAELFKLGATARGVDVEVARLWSDYFPVAQRAAFVRLLRTVESPVWNLILTGRPRRFTALSGPERERYLVGWATSRLGAKRQGFQSVKRLANFLFYALPDARGTNPVWADVGYAASEVSEASREVQAAFPPGVSPDGVQGDLTCDVCVVGSGAGGSVIASALARAGRRVVIVESGPYRDRGSFTGREAESTESMFQRHGLLTTTDLAFQVLAGETAGGSTTINWMTCLRPSATVRAEWERLGAVGAGTKDFDAHLEAVWARLGVGREESDVNPSNEVLRRGAERLGFALGSDYDIIDRNAVGCQRRCDYCTYGCPYDAKRSSLVTYLADALAAGARLLCHSRAERVLLEGGRAVGVEIRRRSDAGTDRSVVHARCVVLAGGAVQTPALLLRSGIRHAGVGRGLRLHPTTALLGEFPYPIETWKGPMQTVVIRRFVHADAEEHGPWLESAPAHPGLAALATPWEGGAAHKEAMTRFPRTAATIVLIRDVGEGRVGTDRAGEAELTYRLARRDRENLTRGLIEAARIHRAAGAQRIQTLHARPISVGNGQAPLADREFEQFLEEVRRAGIVENAVQLFSAHPTGSARIGVSSATAAVDARGACFGVENLWVGDGALLPSAPGVNPMITIMAFARRTADAILASSAV